VFEAISGYLRRWRSFRLGEVDADIEDVRLFTFFVLPQDNRESFLFFPILAIEETDRSLALLVLRVADAASIICYPTRRLHSLFGIEVLHLLRTLRGGEGDEAHLSLHSGPDYHASAERKRQVGLGCARNRRHVRPQSIYRSGFVIASEGVNHPAGTASHRNQQTDQDRIRDAHFVVGSFAALQTRYPAYRRQDVLSKTPRRLMINHRGLRCSQDNWNPGCLLDVGFANFKLNLGRGFRNHKRQRDVL